MGAGYIFLPEDFKRIFIAILRDSLILVLE